ncbi:MAG: alpha/beta fold hydrolase [Deltaproteobacteria bacterium]|nr:alpha/beta fold hydrolase [Deltaproteobacteria bacterium]
MRSRTSTGAGACDRRGGGSSARGQIAPTPRATVLEEGSARLYRFGRGEGGSPVLLVPSLINRWYILDLRAGASVAGALVGEGFDTWCLDWGVPGDEDRHLRWDDVLARLARAARVVRRTTGFERISLLGYCMGGTLAGIHAALHPEHVSALVNLAGPFDFSRGGVLSAMADGRWFDADAIASAGNVNAAQMQSAFLMLRPTAQVAKWVSVFERGRDASFRDAFAALESWSNDTVPFPAAAYRTYIRELYQENRLARGGHHVGGRPVDLSSITCPVLTIVASEDAICPPAAATALNDLCGSSRRDVLTVPGGHVGAVVGSRATKTLYPALVSWLRSCC